ncbi:PA3715 family protein [Aquimarina rubra]|uniref:DUF5041 domain-containing protein n=1 Tax=Aquimarina rubra TaxID=1920033 RepID=A0ABW5LFL6_9FLAO
MKHLLILFVFILFSCKEKIKDDAKTIQTAVTETPEIEKANNPEKPIEKAITKAPQTEFNLIDAVVRQLKINPDKIEFVAHKKLPNIEKESIVVIAETATEEDDYFRFNSHVLVVESATGQILNTFFESYETNGWQSDALFIDTIAIDTAPYNVTETDRAFGIRIYSRTLSQPNPYSLESISLFVKSENTLRNILKNYEVKVYGGEWDTICYGEFTDVKKTLIISKEKSNDYFDIVVKSNITETKNDEDENGECISKEKRTTSKTVLKFNGKEYKSENL